MKKVRWGVIGAGGIADRRTIPGMLQAKNAELTAVMDIDRERAEQLKEKYHAKYSYNNEMELLKNPEVDAVYIASPVVCHYQQAKAAADCGKHILIEKPVAFDAQQGEELLSYCHEKNVKIAAGFMMRFGTHVINMKQAVAEGKIGQLVSAYAQFTLWLPESSGNWRTSKKDAGGGSLMDMGVHCIDLLEYISGSRITKVGAWNETTVFHYDVEDSSTVLLRMENGAQCVVQTNYNIPDEAAKWRLEFFGTRGRLLGDTVIGQNDGGTLNGLFLEENVGYNATQDHAELKGIDMKGCFGNMYTREIESFSDSILNGTEPEVPARDAVHVQRVVELAYKSTLENKFFDID